MTTVLRPKPKQYTIDQFMHTTRMSGISFCPDEREILVTSNLTGITNAYAIAIADGTCRQLTFSKSDPIKALSFFPRDHRILYAQDVGGSENRHLWVQEENGRTVSLTNVERVKTGFYGWSKDGQYLYCSTDERAKSRFDLYQVDTRTYEKSMIF